MKVKDLFLDNLLFPALALVLISVVSILNRKLAFVKLGNLIILICLSSLIIGLAGLSVLLNIPFLPYLYIYIFILFILIGYFYKDFISDVLIHPDEQVNHTLAVVVSLSVLFIGSYLFSILFNLSNELHYGFIASTSTFSFVLPLFFNWTFKSLVDIPSGIYKVWKYNPHVADYDYTSDTVEKIILLELILSRNPENPDVIKVKAKAPIGLIFGNWFQLFLNDYNAKYLDNPIVYDGGGNEQNGWMFYEKKHYFLDKKYIDPQITIQENKLNDQTIINCKRVSESYGIKKNTK